MIEVKNLSVGYGSKDIVKQVSMAFEPGKVTILLGPNGSGKATLLKAVLGLLPISAGEIFYDGIEIKKMKRKEIARKAAF